MSWLADYQLLNKIMIYGVKNWTVMFSYFWINEVSEILERLRFGMTAIMSVVVVRSQPVVTWSLYIDGSQILAQMFPVPEEEPCDLQNKWAFDVSAEVMEEESSLT